ncbi:YhgE/Pip domain-containing protein [Virgibacillus xinjiangensis]|uniref:YhgE/Pip domain-containing protein n=1 Tax=Virgibacillus xinjiangensis TaxID=393090 RepID=A0ABV7CX63_9BACI
MRTRFTRVLAAFLAFLLVLPTVLVSAEKNGASQESDNTSAKGSYSTKNEVVYATLNPAGDQKSMYVVNNFTMDEPGEIIDYGPYSSVENLTNLKDIEQTDDRVAFTSEEEEFYYQGNLEDKPLPWDINVSYQLDGETVKPEELLGQDGHLEIQIETAQNEDVGDSFFNNYLLQISLPMDTDIYENIEAPDGMVANAGKDRQVTFTVMPEKEESFTVSADAVDLEMEAIEIAAMPSVMSIDEPDTGEMKNEMTSLSDATADIHQGVGELESGVAELNDGVKSLYDGSEQYRDGIIGLDNGSAELLEGSESIQASLKQMSDSVSSGSSEMNTEEFQKLEDGLRQIAGGLEETETGLLELKDQYAQAYQALDEGIASIPEAGIAEEDIQALYQSDADPEVIDQLVKTYEGAQTAKQTYAQVKEAFVAVEPTLDEVAGSLSEMSTNLTEMADSLASGLENMDVDESMTELQEGLQTLSSSYGDFHAGLKEYTGGTAELATSYEELHDGMAGLTDGTSELEDGAAELHDGTGELAASTSDLPDEMQKEIDEMMNEFDKSDFDPVSFVSEKNEKVDNVQFVIKTESIKKDEVEQEEPEQEEEKGFWGRLLDLFR